jgi:hypothetical protein
VCVLSGGRRYQRCSAQVVSETKGMCLFALARHLALVAAYEASVLRLPPAAAAAVDPPHFGGHWQNHATHGLEAFLRGSGTPAEMCATVARMEAERDELLLHDGGALMNIETTRWGRDSRITQKVGQAVMHVFSSPSVQDQVEWHQARWEGASWVVRVHRPHAATDFLVRRYLEAKEEGASEMVVEVTTVANGGGEKHVRYTRRFTRQPLQQLPAAIAVEPLTRYPNPNPNHR